jgi:hypothetical protein
VVSRGPGNVAISVTVEGVIGTRIAEYLVDVVHPSLVRQDLI